MSSEERVQFTALAISLTLTCFPRLSGVKLSASLTGSVGWHSSLENWTWLEEVKLFYSAHCPSMVVKARDPENECQCLWSYL